MQALPFIVPAIALYNVYDYYYSHISKNKAKEESAEEEEIKNRHKDLMNRISLRKDIRIISRLGQENCHHCGTNLWGASIYTPAGLWQVDEEAFNYQFYHQAKHIVKNDSRNINLTISAASFIFACLFSKYSRPLPATLWTAAATGIVIPLDCCRLEMAAEYFAIKNSTPEELRGELRRIKAISTFKQQQHLKSNKALSTLDFVMNKYCKLFLQIQTHFKIREINKALGNENKEDVEKEKLLVQLFTINACCESKIISIDVIRDSTRFKIHPIKNKENQDACDIEFVPSDLKKQSVSWGFPSCPAELLIDARGSTQPLQN